MGTDTRWCQARGSGLYQVVDREGLEVLVTGSAFNQNIKLLESLASYTYYWFTTIQMILF
jgi:hypothetical protein